MKEKDAGISMNKVLILYSSTDGQTLKICQRLKQLIEQEQYRVALVSVDALALNENVEAMLIECDKIVIGASIRYGKHSKKVIEFIERHSSFLEEKPSAFFSVNLVARKQERSQPQTNPYVVRFLREIPWQPNKVAVFAGKLDYPKYTFSDRLMIRLIMWMTKGPTNPKAVIEYTNWEEVDNFGRQIIEL